MKTKSLFLFLAIFLFFSCVKNENTSSNSSKPTSQTPIAKNQQPKINSDTTTKNQPVQTNQTAPKTKKYGIKFALPSSWKTTTEEFKATDLKGNVVSIQSDYKDNNESTISFNFHPGEKGKQLYAYKLKKMDKEAQQISIGHKKAIQTIELLKTDGKGHSLKTPTKRIIVSLLTDKGEIDFVCNATNEASEKTFHDFISNIKF